MKNSRCSDFNLSKKSLIWGAATKARMRNKVLVTILFLTCLNAFSQKDTVIGKNQKGFLFLTGYNLYYDFNPSEVKSYGFSDYFFPLDSFNRNVFLDNY